MKASHMAGLPHSKPEYLAIFGKIFSLDVMGARHSRITQPQTPQGFSMNLFSQPVCEPQHNRKE